MSDTTAPGQWGVFEDVQTAGLDHSNFGFDDLQGSDAPPPDAFAVGLPAYSSYARGTKSGGRPCVRQCPARVWSSPENTGEGKMAWVSKSTTPALRDLLLLNVKSELISNGTPHQLGKINALTSALGLGLFFHRFGNTESGNFNLSFCTAWIILKALYVVILGWATKKVVDFITAYKFGCMSHTRRDDQMVEAFSAPKELIAQAKARAAKKRMSKSRYYRYCLAKDLGYPEALASEIALHGSIRDLRANFGVNPAPETAMKTQFQNSGRGKWHRKKRPMMVLQNVFRPDGGVQPERKTIKQPS